MNENISEIIRKQRRFFQSNRTKSLFFRRQQLKKLRLAILANEKKIAAALKRDLNKSYFEAYETEIGIVISELRFMEKHVQEFAKLEKVKTQLIHFPAQSKIYKEPYGCTLIMSPYNYPFQLAVMPLIAAIAAGNCAIIKPAPEAVYTQRILSRILSECFESNYIYVLTGGIEVSKRLLNEKFDLIFFTGGAETGKIVMAAAARTLTPVVLELGGKSPCIVHKTANIRRSAKRIVFGKWMNAGQTCVAPDYILVQKEVKEAFIHYMKLYIKKFYGNAPEKNQDYPKIVNRAHLKRLLQLCKEGRIRTGGSINLKTNQMEPTILDQVPENGKLMRNEIFGPILPVFSFDTIEAAAAFINKRPQPLALYVFSESKKISDYVITHIAYGGGCVNDTITHLASSYLPFGGIGESGIGSYHGKAGFDAFSHKKSLLIKSSFWDIPMRYPNFKNHLWLLKLFYKYNA